MSPGRPTGDDAVAGWQWTRQDYDYNGRATVTTNPDGTQRTAEYGGCGCAGGDVVTVRDEAGRRRRLSNDVFGRLVRVEELNWDTSVYSTTNYAFNARDQITTVTQQNDRQRSFVYDGHGRLQTRTTPEQGATTYSYYGDDTIQTVTDARGASSTFVYNSRGLVTNINYGVPSGVEPTPNVAFDYDAAGNRLWMTDGFGRVDYAYNTISQLTSETRTFSDPNYPNLNGAFTLSYDYNLGGQLKSITNPWGYTNSYSFDQMGRMATLNSTYGSASYITGVQYRAFGSPKQISYGNNRALSINYDNRLRLTRADVAGVLGSDYEYRENTFRTTFARSRTDSTLDRWYYYDHVGRLHIARSGSEARAANGEGWNGQYDGPYSMGFYYDVWGNITQRDGWGGWNASYTATFNNKNQMTTNPGLGTAMQYDAAGNMTNDGWQSFTYDASGSQVQAPTYGKWQGHDGDGLRVKDNQNGGVKYYLRSTVLGGRVVAELNSGGGWTKGYVYAGEQVVALQYGSNYFVHQDPLTKSQRITDAGGNVVESIELDPFGGETNRSTNQNYQTHRYTTWERDWTGDESLFRRYHGWWSRFAHPDPYDGSYDFTNPQSLNRYSYVENDPVNLVDPTGLFIPPFWLVGWALNSGSWTVNVYGSFSSFFGGGGGGGGSHELLMEVGDFEFGGGGGGGPQEPLPKKTPEPPDPCVAAAFAEIHNKRNQTAAANKAITLLLKEASKAGLTAEQTAYVLATAEHESNMGNSMVESYRFAATRNYGGGPAYRGRGYPHLTHDTNYRTFGIVNNPALAADPERSAGIIISGMVGGAFTNGRHTLERHIPRNGQADFINARRIINGLDRARRVAGYAEDYLNALKKCRGG